MQFSHLVVTCTILYLVDCLMTILSYDTDHLKLLTNFHQIWILKELH